MNMKFIPILSLACGVSAVYPMSGCCPRTSSEISQNELRTSADKVSIMLDVKNNRLTINHKLDLSPDCSYEQLVSVLGKSDASARSSSGLSSKVYNWDLGIEALFCEGTGKLLTFHIVVTGQVNLVCGEHRINNVSDLKLLPESWDLYSPSDNVLIRGLDNKMVKMQFGAVDQLFTFTYTFMINYYDCAKGPVNK